MSSYQEIRLAIDDKLTIKCCSCYESYWKKVKCQVIDHKFDESIEKNKSIRKFFIRENVLFHFCFPCLKEVLIKKKIVVVKEWVYAITKDKDKSHAAEMSCIADVLNHRNDIENICF